MRALVVFESMFGNSQAIAAALGEGLSSRIAADITEVGSAPTAIDPDVALLVVGGPTHAFGLSRPMTRQGAAASAAGGRISAGIGLREWLADLPRPAGVAAAAFTTRMATPHWVRHIGSAARGAERRLRRRGIRIIAPSEEFYVTAMAGPLVEGELDRARRWGEALAAALPSN